MKANIPFRIDYIAVQEPTRAAEGWGSGQLWLDGKPFWFFGTEQEPELIEWTWIDMFEHLAFCWQHLKIESPFPFPWIADAMCQGINFWQIADDRWEEMNIAEADAEEGQLLMFARFHNLAAGWQGLGLPALYWYRQGSEVLLCGEGHAPVRIDYIKAMSVLEQFSASVVEGLSGSSHPRAMAALKAWHSRDKTPLSMRIAIATGLELEVIGSMCGNMTSQLFWEVDEAANGTDFDCNVLLAAARMTSSSLGADEIARLLSIMRQLPSAIDLPKLEGDCKKMEIGSCVGTPYEQGYELAAKLRGLLKIDESSVFDPEKLLECWGVDVVKVDFCIDTLEAIAVWGKKKPTILVNSRENIRPSHDFGYRFVLSHEIAHLLVDRGHSLSAAEVLGGGVPKKVEQRADAFAAEVLLPRQAAASIYREEPHLDAAITRLVETYKVSRKVAKAQIKNSGAATASDENEIDLALGISKGVVLH